MLSSIPRTIEHELESVFYVFLWICTVIAGPHFKPRASMRFDFEKTPLYRWFSDENLYDALSAKAYQISSTFSFETEVLRYFHCYFGNDFKECARELRKLFERRYIEEKKLPSIVSHESFLGSLRKLERKLPSAETEIPQEEEVQGYSSFIMMADEEILYAMNYGNHDSYSSSEDCPDSTKVVPAEEVPQSGAGSGRAGRTHPMRLRNITPNEIANSTRKRRLVDEERIESRNKNAVKKRPRISTELKIV